MTLALYRSETTPVLDLPDVGVLIGHVFDRSGGLITDSAKLPNLRDASRMGAYLLANCWGDYVVIQPSAEDSGFTAMSAPSCSSTLPCLYSFHDGRGFLTSSTVLPGQFGLYRRQVDWDYVAQFLMYPFLKTERCPLAGINELLPGMLARFSKAGVSTELAWTPWDFVAPGNRYAEFCDAANSVHNAVSTALKGFSTVDRSILLELSGGLDSSIVGIGLLDAAAAVFCSTLVAPVPGADERLYADLVAERLQTPLRITHLPVESARFSFEDASDPVRPGVGPLQYAIDSVMGADAGALGVDSAYSGGGGDTVFSYLRTAAPAVDALRERGPLAGLRSIQDLAKLHQCSVWRALQLTIRKHLRSPRAPYQPDTTFLMPSVLDNTGMEHPWHHPPADALPGDRERIFELAGSQIFMDYLPRRAKRFLRMPLLSQPVMEACLRTPSWMWISGGQNRAVARAAFADSLPADILSRRSKGSFMSYLGEVYERNKASMLDFLLSGNLRSHGILDPVALQRFVGTKLPPRDRTFTRVMDLCRVENWTRQQG